MLAIALPSHHNPGKTVRVGAMLAIALPDAQRMQFVCIPTLTS
jgi:hypothetical protein